MYYSTHKDYTEVFLAGGLNGLTITWSSEANLNWCQLACALVAMYGLLMWQQSVLVL